MNRTLVAILIVALVCLGNVTRAAYRARIEQPRFAAEGAAHLRYTEMIARGEPIPALDRPAQWPEGLRVFREASPAMEYLYGWIYRALPGTKPGLIPFIRFFTAFFFSLAIVPAAMLSARLWKSRAAGLGTALVFAVAPALVARSSGFEFIRENVTIPILVAHVSCFVAGCAGGGVAWPILSGAFLFGALLSWQGAQFYLVPFLLFMAIRRVVSEPGRGERRAMGTLVLSIAVAGALVPYLRESRFLLSTPVALALAWLAVDACAPRLLGLATKRGGAVHRARPAIARVCIAAAAVAAVVIPGAISGRHAASYAHFFALVLYKLRSVAKPDDPTLLPFDARAFWVGPFDSPDARNLFVFALPVLLLLPAPCARLARRARTGDFEALFALVFLVVSFCLYLLMQRLLPLFGVFAAVVAGGNAPALTRGAPLVETAAGSRRLPRAATPAFFLAAFAVVIFLFQDFAWEGRGDFWRRIARSIRVPSRETFVIYPEARDVDGELLSWMRGNVEPDAVVMSLHYLSPQVLTYTGRATNLNDFFESPALRRKAETLLRRLYSSEDELYRFCAEESSSYLLVSCALGCDPTKESPLYQAGRVTMPRDCAAFRLVFEPEKLAAFDLVYENEMYRLFRVGRAPRERAWPRSPLFYDGDFLASAGGNTKVFYDSAMRIYALTDRGRRLIAAGAERAGEEALVHALDIFYFYPAWKALDELYAKRGRIAEREGAASLAYRRDPNRVDVSLALASSRIERGEPEGVRAILERCSALPASAAERRETGELLRRLESEGR